MYLTIRLYIYIDVCVFGQSVKPRENESRNVVQAQVRCSIVKAQIG